MLLLNWYILSKYLLAVFLFISLSASAQITYQGGVTTTVNNRGALTVDSVFKAPERDTTPTFTGQRYRGRITVTIDSNLYYHNGKKWVRLSNQTTDTTSLSNRINAKKDAIDSTANSGYVTHAQDDSAKRNIRAGVTTTARAAISETVTGLDYNNTTGVLSQTTGYIIPTTTEQTTWNNKIGGSGSTNFIPMFSGASTLTTSGMRSDGSKVAINDVVNASYHLFVNGLIASASGFRSGNNDGIANANNTGMNFVTNAGTGVQINTINGGYYIDIREGGTVRLRIGDGKVLVNSTSNRGAGALEVTGNISVLGTTNNTYRWDATSGTPTSTASPAGWVKISIAGVDAWLPYYQ